MISTPISSTSDYYSSSDLECEDDDDNVVKAAAQYHSSAKETNIILQTLLHYHQPLVYSSSTIKVQQSIRLLKLVKDNYLSDEVFIRANTILHKFLLSTCTNHIDESILMACLSLATKLSEHSNHFNITLFNSNSLILNENMICNALDWDIDLMTPINYIEAILLHLTDCSIKDRIRKLSYELIVVCLTNVSCMDLSVVSVGRNCLLMACEWLNCYEIVPKQAIGSQEDKDTLLEACFTCMNFFKFTNESIPDIIDLYSPSSRE